MSWLAQFLLGRPNYESQFDINPSAMKIDESQIAAQNRTLDGTLHKYVFRTSFPTISLDSNYFLLADRNTMASLLTVTDTVLSFIPRTLDLSSVLEVNVPTTATSITIQKNSATILSSYVTGAGGSSTISVQGIYDNPSGTGTNYWTGGSYADSTYTITPGTNFPSLAAMYVTYNYSGWAVMMDKIPYSYQGGWIDKGNYSGWVLTGV